MTAAQRLERVEVCGGDLVEARAIGQLGVARGQVDQRALVAALRHQDPHAAAGARRQPLLHRLAVFDLHRQIDLGRRHRELVELRQGRLQDVGVAAGDGARRR